MNNDPDFLWEYINEPRTIREYLPNGLVKTTYWDGVTEIRGPIKGRNMCFVHEKQTHK